MLYVCPTPIGNLGDITLRVLDALRQADLIAAEDTRRTRKLLSHFDISKPLVSFFEHNEIRRLPDLLNKMNAGKTIALVSDAGMPGICDPGYRFVKAALDEGLQVVVLPGPSAVETALVSSGFPSDSFVFLGYLPRKKGELDKVLGMIAGESRTCVAFETPHRLAATLTAAVPHLGDRHIAVCRELTKKFEEILRGTASELRLRMAQKVKGEIVLVFEPRGPRLPEETGPTDTFEDAIRGLLEEGISARKLSELVALATGVSKNRAYKLTLQIKQNI
ncbi:MAG: 16S rRNA (cytidine(1402)-2'-O)-methyltransferase [Thermoleophilia bacterium]